MNITVNGLKSTTEELMINLPHGFEGADFTDMHELSLINMYWACYREAYFDHNMVGMRKHGTTLLVEMWGRGMNTDGLTWTNLIEEG